MGTTLSSVPKIISQVLKSWKRKLKHGQLRKYGNVFYSHWWQDDKYCLAVSWVKLGLLRNSKKLDACSKKLLSFWRSVALLCFVLPKVCSQQKFYENRIKSSITAEKEIVHQCRYTRSSRLSSWWKAAMTRLRRYFRWLLGRSMSNATRVMNLGSDDSITAPGKKRRLLFLYQTKVLGGISFIPITFSDYSNFPFLVNLAKLYCTFIKGISVFF